MKGVSKVTIVALSLALSAAAFAAEHELQWDNNVFRICISYDPGANTWAGIDYDTSTLKTTRWRLARVRANLGPGRNGSWDGMRLAVYDLEGGTPGKIIWPKSGTPKFVKGYGTPDPLAAWCEFPVGFELPQHEFVVALEQYYDPPACDTYGVGYGRGFADRHTWFNYRNRGWEHTEIGTWMLRAVVEGPTNIGVVPASLGRVKALYY
jgi:hypothetical protein